MTTMYYDVRNAYAKFRLIDLNIVFVPTAGIRMTQTDQMARSAMSRCAQASGSRSFFLALIFITFFASNVFGTDDRLQIAAASSLRNPLEQIVALFKKEHPVPITISYGASGALYAQLIHGAPFDLFLSSDKEPIDRLVQQGLAETTFEFGRGRLVLWSPHESSEKIRRAGIQGLLDPSIRKIAVAHPIHAPYGQAARVVLNHFGVYGKIKDKLIFGEDVAQAAHFVASGAADVGIVAYAILKRPVRGAWLIPDYAHPPLRQVGVLLKKSTQHLRVREETQTFIQFITHEKGKEIFQSWMEP